MNRLMQVLACVSLLLIVAFIITSTPLGVGRQGMEERSKADEQAKINCRADERCWAKEHLFSATYDCSPHIERLAKNDFQWTVSKYGEKFSRGGWKDREAGTLFYVGDKIKFQNGFGAWTFHTYRCEYDPNSKTVLNVRAYPGRLPE